MSSGSQMSHRLAFHGLAVALFVLLSPALVLAAGSKAVEIEDARVGFEDRFKIGVWTPVRVQVRGGADSFEGILEVIADDDDGTPTRMRVPLQVKAADSTRVTAYTRAGSRSPNFRFRVLDRENRAVTETTLEVVRASAGEPIPIYPTDITILALGNVQGVDLIGNQPGMKVTLQGATREISVARVPGQDADLLPGRPQGYDAFDTVVVDTNDKVLMAALVARGPSLLEWVARGGHLVVAAGSNWQSVRESILAPALPVKLTGQTRVNDLRALESFCGSSSQITPDNVAAMVTKLEGADVTGAKVLSTTSSSPLVVRGAYGFGRVTVVAFDVDAPPFSTWADRGLFWIKALDLTPGGSSLGASKTSGRLVQSGASGLSSVLRTALDQFSGVRLVPFGWVAFLIFLYVLLIGPFDYFFLKKVVKRMELTWVTFPLIVISVSVAAAYAAYTVKGTELRVNQIELLDVDESAKQARGLSFLNVFSPSNQDYDIAVKPLAVGSGASNAASANYDVKLSWLGTTDNGLRGMMGSAKGLSFVNEGYSYAPDASAERIEHLRIPIWSTKSLAAQWFGKSAGALIESDLQQVGPDRISGTITNRLDSPLRNTIVAFGSQVYYNIPEIAPGATIRIELSLNRQLSGYLGELRKSYQPRDDAGAVSTINRANLLKAILFSGSENTGLDPLSNGSVEQLDLSDQLQLDRPMLVAEVDRPVSEVEIKPTSATPKVARTTLIRAILPLDRTGGN